VTIKYIFFFTTNDHLLTLNIEQQGLQPYAQYPSVNHRQGDHCYASSNMGHNLASHIRKNRRSIYHDPRRPDGRPLEYNGNCIHHLIKFEALYAGWAEHFDLDLGNQSRLLRSRLPIEIYASDHIIWGKPGREFLDMRIIRYFDNGKPLKEPEIWFFQFHAKHNADDVMGEGDVDKVGGSSKKEKKESLNGGKRKREE
jgi:hypothetical protein